MVDFTPGANAAFFQIPIPLHFGIKFEISSCAAIGVLFAINSIQAIGDFSATTTGSMDRMPTDQELKGGIFGYGISNIIGALLGLSLIHISLTAAAQEEIGAIIQIGAAVASIK